MPLIFLNSGINQYLDGENICAVEWAERIKPLWHGRYVQVKLEMIGENKRKIEIKGLGKSNVSVRRIIALLEEDDASKE